MLKLCISVTEKILKVEMWKQFNINFDQNLIGSCVINVRGFFF